MKTSAKSSTEELTAMDDKNMPVGKWGRGLVYFLIFAVPLVFLPDMWLTSSWETPRRLILFAVSGLLFVSIAEKISVSGRLAWRRHAFDIPVLLLLLAAWITGITGIYPAMSLTGPVWSQFGLPLMGCGYLLYFAVKEYITTEVEIETSLRLLVIAGAISSFIGYLDYFHVVTLNPLVSGLRLVGTIGNAMFTGSFLAMCILPAIFLLLRADRKWRIILAGCLVLLVPALVLTQARGAWIGLATALLLVGAVSAVRVKKPAYLSSGVAVLVVMLVAIFFSPSLRGRATNLVSGRDGTVGARLVYMQAAVNMFKERPLLGWGTGSFQYLLTQYRPVSTAVEGATPINRGFSYAQAHCMPLQIAAEMGLAGLIPLLALLVMLVIMGIRAALAPGAAGLLSLALLGVVATYFGTMLTSFDNGATLMVGWVAISLMASLGAREQVISRWPELSPLWKKISHIKAFVLGMLVVSLTVMQLLAAYYMQKAQDLTVKVNNLARTDRPAAYQLALDVLTNYERATMMTPVLGVPEMGVHIFNVDNGGAPLEGPGEFGIISFGDESTWRARTYMQRTITDLGKPEDMDGAFYMTMVAGKMTLRVTDRNDIMFLLIQEYLRFNNQREARALMNKALVYAPNCAETHWYNSQLLLLEKQPEKALTEVKIANELDPTSDVLPVQFGNVYTELSLASAMPDVNNAALAIDYYHQGEMKRALLTGKDRLYLAQALFTVGDYPAATRQVVQLRGKPEEESLKSKLTDMGERLGRQEKAHEVVAGIMQ